MQVISSRAEEVVENHSAELENLIKSKGSFLDFLSLTNDWEEMRESKFTPNEVDEVEKAVVSVYASEGHWKIGWILSKFSSSPGAVGIMIEIEGIRPSWRPYVKNLREALLLDLPEKEILGLVPQSPWWSQNIDIKYSKIDDILFSLLTPSNYSGSLAKLKNFKNWW